ncbi:MAG: hypothetical protein IKN38_09055 [Clostridia bacterium]|nr:hypothetical protein [Clostridia bacterium]
MKCLKLFKKALSLCLVLLFALSILAPAAVRSEGEEQLEEVKFYSRATDAVNFSQFSAVDGYAEDNFFALTEGIKADRGTYRGREGLVVTSDDDVYGGTFYLVYDAPKDLSAFHELCFQIRFDSDENVSNELSVTFSSAGQTYTVSGVFSGSTNYEVFCPLNFDAKGSIDHIYFSHTSGRKAGTFYISALYADKKYTYSHIDLFSADSFSSDAALDMTEDAILVDSAVGTFYIEAENAVFTDVKESAVARVAVSGVDSGTMTLSIKGAGDDVTEISTINLFPGENVYSFICQTNDKRSSYKISFSGVFSSDGAALSLNGVKFIYFDGRPDDDTEQYPAAISSCAVSADGRSVSAKGTVSSSFVVSSLDKKIGIAAVDMRGENDAVIVAKGDMTTLFDMKFDVSGVSTLPGLCRYFVVLIDEDSEDGPERISASVYPSSAQTAVPASGSVIGVESDDSAAPFNANASYTVVDVYADKLIGGDQSQGRFHSFGSSYYYISTSYLSRIDSKISLYLSSGLNVYVRLLISAKDAGFVYSSVDTENEEEVQKYAAAVDYLTERYPSIYGLIVGERVNIYAYNGSLGREDLFLYAKNYATLLRITSAAARANIPSCAIVSSFGDEYIYSDEAIPGFEPYDTLSGVGAYSCDPTLLSVLISRCLSVGGGIQWDMMYECEGSPAKMAELSSNTSVRLQQNVGSSPNGCMLYWKPEHEMLDEELSELSSELLSTTSTFGVKSVIVSLEYQTSSDASELLKSKDFDPDGVRVSAASKAAVSFDASLDKDVIIYDFRRSFGTGDFFTGGDFETLTTVSDSKMSGFDEGTRALRAQSGETPQSGGILMARFKSPLQLSAASNIRIALCASSNDGSVCRGTVVIGDGVIRHEYRFEAQSGIPSLISCATDEAGFDAASYIAIELASNEGVTLDLSRVSLYSDDGDVSAIKEALGKKEEEKDRRGEIMIPIIVSVTVFSTVIFAVISFSGDHRHKKNKSHTG